MSKIKFEYEYVPNKEELIWQIDECEGRHTQQAIYSTFHSGLTQVCFGCRKIRSTIKRSYQRNSERMRNKWIVTERIPTIFIALGIVGIGYLGSLIPLGSSLSEIGMGILVSGVVLGLSYKWEYYEKENFT